MENKKPVIRVRIAHVHTLKDGWRTSETTVEYTGEGGADWELIGSEMTMSYISGSSEAAWRNKNEKKEVTNGQPT